MNKKLIFGAVILAILIFNIVPFSGGDNLKYYHLSRAIRDGQGYRSVWLYNTPLHSHYPPLFPLILAIAPNYLCAKILIFVLFLLTLFAVSKLFDGLELPDYTILIFAFTPLLLIYSHWVLSEIPYLLLSTLTLLCFFNKKYGLAFLCAICSCMIRTAGLSLFVAISIVYWIRNRKWKIIVMMWIPIVAWFIYTKIHGGGYSQVFWWIDPYNTSLGKIGLWELLVRVAENFYYMFTIGLPMLFGNMFFAFIFVILIALGIDKIKKNKNQYILLIYLAGYLLSIWIFPSIWMRDGRHYLPLLPVFCILIADGLVNLKSKFEKKC